MQNANTCIHNRKPTLRQIKQAQTTSKTSSNTSKVDEGAPNQLDALAADRTVLRMLIEKDTRVQAATTHKLPTNPNRQPTQRHTHTQKKHKEQKQAAKLAKTNEPPETNRHTYRQTDRQTDQKTQ